MRYGGEGAAQAGLLDGINAIEFSDDPVLDFDSLVARTFLFTDVDGTILEADILVNNRRFQFNTDGGDIGLDLQTVLTKELGHALGLDNSPVGLTSGGFGSVEVDETSAVMFAIARGPGQTARVLTDDDIAGVSAMYPDGTSLGGISGTRHRRSGSRSLRRPRGGVRSDRSAAGRDAHASRRLLFDPGAAARTLRDACAATPPQTASTSTTLAVSTPSPIPGRASLSCQFFWIARLM